MVSSHGEIFNCAIWGQKLQRPDEWKFEGYTDLEEQEVSSYYEQDSFSDLTGSPFSELPFYDSEVGFRCKFR